MNWDLIIFDCDGVLVDSESIADRIFSEVLASEGFSIPSDDSKEWFTGYSLKSCLELVEKRFGKSVPKDFPKKYYARLFAEFKRSLKPIPGIVDVLDAIPYPVCVASSGTHEKMQISLSITGLLPRFKNRIFSATDVEKGKPSPDLFLYAAEKCNALPKFCAVIEDSVPGIQAGIAAGMTVFGYTAFSGSALFEALKQSGAILFENMKELPKLLEMNNKIFI